MAVQGDIVSERTFSLDDPLARMSQETSLAYDAFMIFFKLGHRRTYGAAADEIGKSVQQVRDWASKYQWKDRLLAYDALVAREAQRRATENFLRDVQEHRDRYRQTGRELHAVARQLLAKIAKMIDNDELTITTSTITQVIKAFETAAELEAHSLSLDRLLPMLDYEEDVHTEQS